MITMSIVSLPSPFYWVFIHFGSADHAKLESWLIPPLVLRLSPSSESQKGELERLQVEAGEDGVARVKALEGRRPKPSLLFSKSPSASRLTTRGQSSGVSESPAAFSSAARSIARRNGGGSGDSVSESEELSPPSPSPKSQPFPSS
mmetsp:Transcript_28407/g.59932  ORF Transcript_28407/g.59932 Transcript_28407/m.59932 type:complete len:146 (+) Transcript_28407:90-527(+)